MNEAIYEELPGGRERITGGGTRNAVKLSRPWQEPLAAFLARGTCPIETKPQEVIDLPDIPEGWKVLPNPMTPHRRHRLIVPDHCWDADKLQVLGGEEGIVAALETAANVIRNDDVEMAFFIHVGTHAGQNMKHPHWHLMEVRTLTPLDCSSIPRLPQRLIAETPSFSVYAEGVRAGQCLIVPARQWAFTLVTVEQLSSLLFSLVARANEKLRSTEGLPPEFSVVIRLTAHYTIRYASYYPILNHWGAPEYVMAPFEGAPFTLPWPHEVTATHLRF